MHVQINLCNLPTRIHCDSAASAWVLVLLKRVPAPRLASPAGVASDISQFNQDLPHFLYAGPIPESIGQMQSLTELWLQNNKLSGSFTNISSGVWDVTSGVPF